MDIKTNQTVLHPVFSPGDEVIYNGQHIVKVLMSHDDCTWILRGYNEDPKWGKVEVIYAMKTAELKKVGLV